MASWYGCFKDVVNSAVCSHLQTELVVSFCHKVSSISGPQQLALFYHQELALTSTNYLQVWWFYTNLHSVGGGTTT